MQEWNGGWGHHVNNTLLVTPKANMLPGYRLCLDLTGMMLEKN